MNLKRLLFGDSYARKPEHGEEHRELKLKQSDIERRVKRLESIRRLQERRRR